MAAVLNSYFLDMHSRYLLDCQLTQLAAMHIGTGVSGADTDSPFICQGETPFVPGSSLRGVLRTTAERMSRSLGGGPRCCVLFEEAPEALCWAGNADKRRIFERANAKERSKFLQSQEFYLCPMCRLFGSTLMAAQLKVSDAQFSGGKPRLVRRDGVGIDRDTETARPKIKYDFEVAEPSEGVALTFHMQIENAGPIEMGVVHVLLLEMERGFEIGGKKSRGLGRVQLQLDKVSYFDSRRTDERRHTLRQFLDGGYQDFPPADFKTWLGHCYSEYLREGVEDAAATIE